MMAERALEGLKVLEWGHFVAVPYCGKLLADMGADVLKIEPPDTGDNARQREPYPDNIPNQETSGFFLYLNTSKRGITLDVSTATGKKIFTQLVKQVDVLVEDHTPAELKALGLTYDVLKKVNPQLIMTSLSPFGQTGPYANYNAYALNTNMAGGEGYLLPGGVTDRPPVRPGLFISDYDGGLFGAIATLGAYYGRQAGGPGQHIDMPRVMATVSLTRTALGKYTHSSHLIDSRDGRGPRIGSNMKMKDGYLVVRVSTQAWWELFTDKVMGGPAWTKEPRFHENAERLKRPIEVNEKLLQWSINQPKKEIERKTQAVGIPAGVIATVKDLAEDEHLAARGFFTELDHPRAGKQKYPGVSYIHSETPWAMRSPAPLLGQHNEDVYVRELGYTREQLVKLREAGVI